MLGVRRPTTLLARWVLADDRDGRTPVALDGRAEPAVVARGSISPISDSENSGVWPVAFVACVPPKTTTSPIVGFATTNSRNFLRRFGVVLPRTHDLVSVSILPETNYRVLGLFSLFRRPQSTQLAG